MYVDAVLATLVGLVRDPLSVGRDFGTALVPLGCEEALELGAVRTLTREEKVATPVGCVLSGNDDTVARAHVGDVVPARTIPKLCGLLQAVRWPAIPVGICSPHAEIEILAAR